MENQERQAVASTPKQQPVRSLSLLRVIALLLAGCSAGPYGFEECIGSGGSSLTVFGLLSIPLIWSVPIALVTAELATAIPENGGHIIWIDRAFGSFWSFQNSFLSFFCNVFECGIYPVMFVDYIGALYSVEFGSAERFAISLIAIVAFLFVNIKGADSVG